MANEIHSLKIGSTTYPIQPEYSQSAGKVLKTLSAGTKSYDGSANVTITAGDLGLAAALKYIGTTSTSITDGSSTTSLTISGSTYTIPTGTSGQVVFYDGKEFIWNGSAWEFLGDDRSFKVIQTAVSSPSADGSTTAFIDTISQNANGVITATKKNVSFPTIGNGTVTIKVNGTSKGSFTLNQTGNAEFDIPDTTYGAASTTTAGLVSTGTQTFAGVKTFNGGITTAGLTSNSNVTISGTCSASSGFFETSDFRLKDFKDPVKVDLDKLSKLTKAYFTFKNDPEKMHLGVSAQEIQEIYPEIVNTNEEGFLSVDYAKLSVIALTAVDELNNRLNNIEKRLAKLEK